MHKQKQINKHPFNSFFSTTSRVSDHQQGRTILDFKEARDDGVVAVASTGPYADHICTLLHTNHLTSIASLDL